EDPGNPNIGIAQPVLEEYKKILSMEPYLPVMTPGEAASFPARLRWGGSEDSDGLAIPLLFERDPVFCEVTFIGEDARLNLMLELNGRWFYKKAGVKTIDLMPAFFNGRLSRESEIPLRVFAPPPDGVNDPEQGDGWETDYRAVMQSPPETRIRYAPAIPPRE
ncbi:MAG: hypothetical protein FWH06_07460, partial [Oscillospiraceae bacterium]|nr:hypothetical protein [Oscillospiraceae bacterium]